MAHWDWILAGAVLVAGFMWATRWPPGRRDRRPPPSAEEIGHARILVEGLRRPMLRLLTSEGAGFSKLGGYPELPPELDWPTAREGPLAFIAQLDLAEVRAAGGPEWLPSAGFLFVFNDADRYGFPDHMKVLFSSGRGPARRPPSPLRAEYEFDARPVRLVHDSSAPSSDWLDLDPGLGLALDDLYPDNAPEHRVGGYPLEIQSGSMALECETLVRRYFPRDGKKHSGPAEPMQTPWRLLLQVDSDDEVGMMWGDAGRLYLFIREEDARAGDFSRTVAVMQCY